MVTIGRALCAAALCIAAGARADDPPCRASVSLEPERAVVGQQVIYRLQILRRENVSRVDWIEALSFPSFRAEWLPGRAPDPGISDVGSHYLVFEERRALFPARAGELAIPGARLACALGEGPAREDFEVAVPGARLHVDALPSQGRPAGFNGVVGRVEVASSLLPERVALGGSVAFHVTVSGAANVWASAPPLDAAGVSGADVHARPPALSLDPGPALVARRSFAYQLVPRRSGRLAVPGVRVAWFDPERGGYQVAEAPALEVAVDEASPAATEPRLAPPPRRAEPAPPGASWRWALGGALGLVAASGGFVAARLALWRLGPRRAAAGSLARAREALVRADTQEASRALATALRSALEARLPGARALSPEEIRARGGDDAGIRAAADALAELDRARFARSAPAASPDPDRVRALVRRL
jgi:hypothetical protein